jgi:1,4-dihydroxy-2-naphthoate octaprenyltransferase
LGEITTAILAAFIVPSWAYSLQTGELNGEIFLLGLPLIPFVTAMMLGIATPDIEADRQVDKITLAVLAGEGEIARLYLGMVMLGYWLAILILPLMLPTFVLIGVGLSIPLAGWAWAGLRHPVKTTTFEWLFMVVRTGLVTLVMILTINAGVWLD